METGDPGRIERERQQSCSPEILILNYLPAFDFFVIKTSLNSFLSLWLGALKD